MDKRAFIFRTINQLKISIVSTIVSQLVKQLMMIYMVQLTSSVTNMILNRKLEALSNDYIQIAMVIVSSLVIIPMLSLWESKYAIENGTNLNKWTFKSFLRGERKLVDKYEKGELIYKLAVDPIDYRFQIHFIISYSIVYFIVIFITLALMLKINVLGALLCLFLSATPMNLDFFLRRKIGEINKKDKETLGEISSEEKSMIDNILYIQSQSIETDVSNSFKRIYKDYYKLLKGKLNIEKGLDAIKDYYNIFCTLAIYLMGSYMVSKNILTIADMVKFIGFSMVLKDNTNYLNKVVYSSLKLKVFLDRMIELTLEEVSGNEDIKEINCIEVKALNFSYGDNTLFNKLSFNVIKGDRLIIEGANGSGKSTLIKILTGIYKNFDGDILINNKNIKDVDLKSLRRECVLASQFPFIMDKTVEENITYVSDNVDKSRITNVMDILKLTDIKDKRAGHNGKFLSGGQRQKISLARVMLSKASLIILDEPDTALDVVTRDNVRKYFEEMGATLIVITHSSGWTGKKLAI